MLTSIGRAAIRRLASTSYRRIVLSQARATGHGPFQPLNLSRPSLNVARGFASQATPKATTAAAKKPLKATATKKATGVKAKAAAKPAAKAKPKTRVTAKAKAKPAVKAKAKPRKKKALSDDDKAALEKKQLKKTALYSEPKRLPETTWQLYVAQHAKSVLRDPGEQKNAMLQLVAAYRSLPSSEFRQLEQTAAQNKLSNAAAYKAWVETLTPPQVVAANNARNALKKKYAFPKSSVKLITDERLPKRPTTPFILFTKARWSSGDFSTAGVTVAAPTIAKEWKSMSEDEKKPYLDLSKTDTERYEKEVKLVLGREVTPPRKDAFA